ncbi:MAG: hypothetical protein II992_01705, partial [Lachnospiraceae bacterium]|nr:hypothetical protein [Lachnospiraceae bacterium]
MQIAGSRFFFTHSYGLAQQDAQTYLNCYGGTFLFLLGKNGEVFLLYRKVRPIKQKTPRKDAHEFVWKMYCVPNSARQSVQAHWESVMSRSV